MGFALPTNSPNGDAAIVRMPFCVVSPMPSLVIVVQTWALARTTPVKAALMFATEPIFAAIFAVSFFGEGMTRREVWGGALIMLGVLTTELWRPVVARLRGRAAA